jgi:hypothetical protein
MTNDAMHMPVTSINGASYLSSDKGLVWRVMPSGDCYAGGFSLRGGKIIVHFGSSKATARLDGMNPLEVANDLLSEMISKNRRLSDSERLRQEEDEEVMRDLMSLL